MFAYLSKKITAPDNTKVKCLSWSKESGFLACGGKGGLFKLLRFEQPATSSTPGVPLAITHSLDGHGDDIVKVVWNEKHQKLTSADVSGHIVVWILYKESWHQEMVNNCTQSPVSSVKWDNGEERVCITYEDGSVIVGAVDGNRLWGKDLKKGKVLSSTWSSDGRLLVFGLETSAVVIFDENGNFVRELSIDCLEDLEAKVRPKPIVLEWCAATCDLDGIPSLAIVYDIGRVQLMRSLTDTAPVLLDVGIQVSCAAWSQWGDILAIGGRQNSVAGKEEKEIPVMQFYTAFGDHMRTLSLPGKNVTSCSWEGESSLRLAISVDAYIYFAIIRPYFQFTYMSDASTVAFLTRAINMPETNGLDSLLFWNLNTHRSLTKQLRGVVALAGGGEYCCVAQRSPQKDQKPSFTELLVHNSLGLVLCSKKIALGVERMKMLDGHIVVTNGSIILAWQYTDPKRSLFTKTQFNHDGFTKCFHIDNAEEVHDDLKHIATKLNSKDPITALAVAKSADTSKGYLLFLCRESGKIMKCQLPSLTFVSEHECEEVAAGSVIERIETNCDGTALALLDDLCNVVLTSVSTEKPIPPKMLEHFPRRDVWDIKFASDHPWQLAIMAKTRLLVFDNGELDEPQPSTTYLADFSDLTVTGIRLDHLLDKQASPTPDDRKSFNLRIYRQCENLINTEPLETVQAFIDQQPHPKLWRLLAEKALDTANLDQAELFFVHLRNFAALKFLKRVRNLQSQDLARGEIEGLLCRYDSAERVFLDADRHDLAIQVRKREGNWLRVAQLVEEPSLGLPDAQLAEIFLAIGQQHMAHFTWPLAKKYLERASDLGCPKAAALLAECLYRMEDWKALERLSSSLSSDQPVLLQIAGQLKSVGLVESAVHALMKCDKISEAVQLCLAMNHWESAPKLLAQLSPSTAKLMQQELNAMFQKTVKQLLGAGRWVEAVQLLRRIGRRLDAARIVKAEAEAYAETKGATLLGLKKFYVLLALLIQGENKSRSGSLVDSTVATELEDAPWNVQAKRISPAMQEQPWRPAEAYHLLMLAQTQLHGGEWNKASVTAKHLFAYVDMLPCEKVHAIIALCCCAGNNLDACSKAFYALQQAEQAVPDLAENYVTSMLTRRPYFSAGVFRDLAFKLFAGNDPRKSFDDASEYKRPELPICYASGQTFDSVYARHCSTCSHSVDSSSIRQYSGICPLCHSN